LQAIAAARLPQEKSMRVSAGSWSRKPRATGPEQVKIPMAI
jgi:hypothetical protein